MTVDLTWVAVAREHAATIERLTEAGVPTYDDAHRRAVWGLMRSLPYLIELVETLAAQVEVARGFADELTGYCSPYGVSSRYADTLRDRLDQAAEVRSEARRG